MKLFFTFILLAYSALSMAGSPLPNGPHIAVIGNAEMKAMPDLAIVHLSLESIKKTSIDAKRNVDERVNNLLDGMAKFDVDEADVSASNISTEVRYSYNRGERDKIEGYVARRTLKVTLNNLENLNAFMDFALKVKVNAIRNIELKSSKEDLLKKEVNALAIKNAKAKGKSLANAFDAELGRVYSINSSSNQSRHRYGANDRVERFAVSGSMNDTSAKAGRYLQENIVFSASVNVVFNLEL